MIIIKQGQNYIVDFNLFTDTNYSANNVIGDLTYNPLELELVDVVVSPAIGTRSIIDPDKYLFGSVLANKHYVVACEFKVLDEKLNLPIEWTISTSSNEVNLSNNSTGINLVDYLDGVLAEDLTLLVADGKLFVTDVDSPYSGVELPPTPGDIPNDTQLRRFSNGVVVAYKWNGTIWSTIFSSDWGEKRICLNSSPFPFAPADPYEPTLGEVATWVATNYPDPSDDLFKRNGTQLSYYEPNSLGNSTVNNNCTKPTHVWVLNDSGDSIALTYRRAKTHTHEIRNTVFSGIEVPTFDGAILGDTASVLFLQNNRLVNYTWYVISWAVDHDIPTNTFQITHMLNELNIPVIATNYSDSKEFTLAAQDGLLTISPIYIAKNTTVTSVQYMLDGVLGDYTGNNYNGIGLYKYNPALDRLELLEKTVNNLNIWKDPIGVLQTKSFENPVVVYPGLYYIAYLYNQSAQVAAPGFLCIKNNIANTDQFVSFVADSDFDPFIISITALHDTPIKIPFNITYGVSSDIVADIINKNFTVKKSGWYSFDIDFSFSFTSNIDSNLHGAVYINNNKINYAQTLQTADDSGPNNTNIVNLQIKLYLSANDVLDFRVYRSFVQGATNTFIGSGSMSLEKLNTDDYQSLVDNTSKFLEAYNVDNVTLQTLQYSGKDSLPLVIQTTDANVTLGAKVLYSLI